MVDKNFEEEDTLVLDDETKDSELSGVINFIQDNFKRSKDWRRFDEERWLQSYRNYRGIYSPDVQFTEAERSRVFIKVTKTKTLAAYGQIVDVLFANNKFPLTIDPTQLPDGVAGDVHFDPKEPPEVRDMMDSPYGFAGDGKDLQPGDTQNTLNERLG